MPVAPASASPAARAPRVPFRGHVRLLVSQPPFRLLLSLRGLNLAQGGLCAQLAKCGSAAEGLLSIGGVYSLQLDPDGSHLPSPVLRGRLMRRVATNAGSELAFSFTPGEPATMALLDELFTGAEVAL